MADSEVLRVKWPTQSYLSTYRSCEAAVNNYFPKTASVVLFFKKHILMQHRIQEGDMDPEVE